MSIGLEDLKKKASSKKFPAGAWSNPKSSTTRPWSSDSLPKSVKTRKMAAPNPEAVMNEEWSSTHAAPLFWVDINESPLLAKVQDHLSAMEERIETSLLTPLRFLKKFIGR